MLYRTSLSAPVFGLRREIDRLFEDTFSRGDGINNWSPAVDVAETERELTLELELPGIRPEDVEITAENNVLTVRGEKRSSRKEGNEDSRYHMIERSYGSFTRSFQLPQGLDESKIEATCDNGILSVHIPKTALPQPRRIEISTQGSNKGANQVRSGNSASQSSGDAKNISGGTGASSSRGESTSGKKSQQTGAAMAAQAPNAGR